MMEFMLRIHDGLDGKPRTSVIMRQSVLAAIPNYEAQLVINDTIRDAFQKARIGDGIILTKTIDPGEWDNVLNLEYGVGSPSDMIDSICVIVRDAILLKETNSTTVEECKGCYYSKIEPAAKLGICRRYPPKFPTPDPTTFNSLMNGDSKLGISWIDDIVTTNSEYPEILPDGWCGEHKAK